MKEQKAVEKRRKDEGGVKKAGEERRGRKTGFRRGDKKGEERKKERREKRAEKKMGRRWQE